MVKRVRFVIHLLLALTITACSSATLPRQEKFPVLTWPEEAAQKRIQFIGAVTSPVDIGIRPSVLEKIWDYLVGKDVERIFSPYGVETDEAGRLYVVDTYLRKVHVFDREKRDYFNLAQADEPLQSPIDIAVEGADGRIYVTDSAAGTVHVYNDGGKIYAGSIPEDELVRPTGIAINDSTGELVVVDTGKSTIYRYDLATHELKGSFGSRGGRDGEFNFPTNVSAGSDGRIFVTDSMNFRVQVFSSDGEFIGKFGQAGDTPGYFSKPKGIATDSDGNIYVVDSLHDAVQIFNDAGQLLMTFGISGNDFGNFWLPSGIFIDEDDRIYISDTYNNRVQIFQYLKPRSNE